MLALQILKHYIQKIKGYFIMLFFKDEGGPGGLDMGVNIGGGGGGPVLPTPQAMETFGGVNDIGIVTGTSPFNTPLGDLNYSTICWFQTTSNNSPMSIFGRDSFNPTRRWFQMQMLAGQIRIVAFTSNTARKIWSSSATFNDGNWHQFVMTIDLLANPQARIYMDGAELTGGQIIKDTDDNLNVNAGATTTDIVFAHFPASGVPANVYTGKIDRCSIWNKTLSLAEVQEEYNGGLNSDLTSHSAYSNVVDYWDFENDTNPNFTGKKIGANGTVSGAATVEASGVPNI